MIAEPKGEAIVGLVPSAPTREAHLRTPPISAHTRSTYPSIRSAENTPEAKLQYVHFARQNGTEM
jgi:hypothetical protein